MICKFFLLIIFVIFLSSYIINDTWKIVYHMLHAVTHYGRFVVFVAFGIVVKVRVYAKTVAVFIFVATELARETFQRAVYEPHV